MTWLNALTDSPKQQHTFVLPDGRKVSFYLEYRENQSGWFYNVSIDTPSGTWASNNRRIVTSPNMLRAFRRVVAFGIACTVTDGHEPVFQTDFTSGRAKLYLLDETDIEDVEELIRNYAG